MIPIVEGQTLDVEVKELGLTLQLKYLTALDDEVRYSKILRKQSRLSDQFRGEGGKIDAEKYSAHQEEHPEEMLGVFADYIDTFVAGWSGPGVAALPAGTKPSAILRYHHKYPVYQAIIEHIEELTGLTVDEVKN
jgi:hypothetical protein